MTTKTGMSPKRRILMVFLLLPVWVSAAQVITDSLYSVSMNRQIPLSVILPDAYRSDGPVWPVVYVLHGYSGDHRNWIDRTDIELLADLNQVLIICPDGDTDSWYLDSPEDSSSCYETHVIREVLPAIDSLYNTGKTREYRAITGLSMGGHGALYLAMRNPGLFVAAGSMSGGMDLRPFADRWSLPEKLGSVERFPGRWEEASVAANGEMLKAAQLQLMIDCGVDDFFLAVNRQLHLELLRIAVPHEYIERPGKHDWSYWNNAVRYQLFFFRQVFTESENK